MLDANGQSLAYVYGRETKADADIAHVLMMDEARRIASNIAKLPEQGRHGIHQRQAWPADRVIDCKDGIQWILQRHYGDQWRGVAFC